VIGASGRRLSLYSRPQRIKDLVLAGEWTTSAIFGAIESAFHPTIESNENHYRNVALADAAKRANERSGQADS
jgi:hypothetical protein